MEGKIEGVEVRETQIPSGAPSEAPAPEPPKPKGKGLIVVGVILLIAGLVVATLPMFTWKNAQQIADSWEGTYEEGYYKPYNEGDKVTMLGEVTFIVTISDILTDTINYTSYEIDLYQDLYDLGYRYAFYLDNEYDLEIYTIEDVGDVGDDISLELRLNFIELGGYDYWMWDARSIERPSALPYYIVGIVIVVVGVVLMGIGIKKYKSSKGGKR